MKFAECHPTRAHRAKGLCGACYDRSRYWQNPEHERLRARKWMSDKHLRDVGLTRLDFEKLLAKQENQCAICKSVNPGGAKTRLVIDHNHATGLARGLLCGNCNVGLGYFKDDPTLLEQAKAYLEHHSK